MDITARFGTYPSIYPGNYPSMVITTRFGRYPSIYTGIYPSMVIPTAYTQVLHEYGQNNHVHCIPGYIPEYG